MALWDGMELSFSRTCVVRGVEATERVLAVAAMFGLGLSENQQITLINGAKIPVRPGEIVLVTGPSGGGKTTLLGCIRRELARREMEVFALQKSTITPPLVRVDPPFARVPGHDFAQDGAGRALVDELGHLPLREALGCLARAGLSDAFVLLRRECELSDGQKFRFALAKFMASRTPILVADEFGATLDRVTAKVVAYQLRKFISASVRTEWPRAAVVATTHEDLGEDLRPDVVVVKELGEGVRVSSGQFPVSSY